MDERDKYNGDEFILLKIKREFTTNEAVQSLLKIVSALEIEIGMLKSERDEAISKAEKVRVEGTKTKKEWLKDDVVFQMDKQMKATEKKAAESQKSLNEWRNKYFSLMARINEDV